MSTDPDIRRLTRRLLDVVGIHPDALQVPHANIENMIEEAVDVGGRIGVAEVLGERYCRVCGCTDLTACEPEPCHWVEADLCSACAAFSGDPA